MKKKLLLLLLLGGFILHSMAQQPKPDKIPDNKYGKDGFRTEKTKTKDGKTTKTTEYYEVRVIDGKRIELLKEKKETEVDNKTRLVKDKETTYHNDGVSIKKSTEKHYFEEDLIYDEEKEYERNGKVRKARKIEQGMDFNLWEYEFDYNKQEYKPIPKMVKHTNPSDISNKSGCIPVGIISVGYSYTNRDYAGDRIAMHGLNASFEWNLKGTVTELPISLKLSINTGLHKMGDQKIILNTFKAGPAIRVNTGNDDIIPSIYLQAGLARDGYKVMNVKSSGNGFCTAGGGNIDWFFKEKTGVRLSAEALLTRFNDKSQWNFIGSTGIVYRIGRK